MKPCVRPALTDAMPARKASFAPVLLAAFSCAAAHAGAADLLAHRAVYEMTLGEDDSRAGVVDVRGGLLVEVEDRCETWAVRQRLALRVTRDAVAVATASTFGAFEAKDGSWYRFDDETVTRPGGLERSSGEASLADEGRPGQILIDEPEPSRHDMPDETLFPMAHLSDLIDRAFAGERFMSHVVYDGADGATVYDITTVVGLGERNDGLTSWPMRLAFHEHGTSAEEPRVEIAVTLRQDGVAEDLVYDYGDFSIDATLVELTGLTTGGC